MQLALQSFMTAKALVLAAGLTALAVPVAAQDSDVRFMSPSGIITCLINPYVAACQIAEYTPSFQSPPADCTADWGGYFSVSARGTAKLACSRADERSVAFTLSYGQTVRFAEIGCTSETTGVTCINGEGRGFQVRRSEQRIF